jgi:hypothetical protein
MDKIVAWPPLGRRTSGSVEKPGEAARASRLKAISPGFGWELRAVDSHRLRFGTLLVLPPLPNSAMHARWERFTKVSETLPWHATPFP